jgi:hypothetical protein
MKQILGGRRANIRTESDGDILCTLETKNTTTTINTPLIYYTLITAVVSHRQTLKYTIYTNIKHIIGNPLFICILAPQTKCQLKTRTRK